jgi:hypothetical protein
VTGDLARLDAARAKADAVAASVGEGPEAGPLLRVAISDAETGQRLATCFVNFEAGATPPRLGEESS